MVDVSQDEREYLLDLLERSHRQLLHELHHTDTNRYAEILKSRIELNERLVARLMTTTDWVAV